MYSTDFRRFIVFYRSTIGSVLTSCTSIWFGNSRVAIQINNSADFENSWQYHRSISPPTAGDLPQQFHFSHVGCAVSPPSCEGESTRSNTRCNTKTQIPDNKQDNITHRILIRSYCTVLWQYTQKTILLFGGISLRLNEHPIHLFCLLISLFSLLSSPIFGEQKTCNFRLILSNFLNIKRTWLPEEEQSTSLKSH